MTTTTAAIVESPGAGFTLSDVVLDKPAHDEVLVRLVAAGLCHTDLGAAAGAFPFPLPGILGHEGAGVVESVGADVDSVRPGDRVLLSFTSCGTCADCRDGHPAYCATWLPSNLIGGRRADGTATVTRGGEPVGAHFFGQSSFARHALVDERSVVKVADDAPLDLLAPLGCGVQTGAGAVWNVLTPRPGATLLVTGAGAVGLSAVMAARLTPATRVIAVDRVASRLELATEVGATDTINTEDTDLTEALAALTGGRGVDGVVETTGAVPVLKAGIAALAQRGTAVIVGAPAFGTEVGVDVNHMIPGRTVTGVTLGDSETRTLIPVLADLVTSGRFPIDRMIRHYDFADIQQAADDVHGGRTIKPVLRF
ncbi:NAD(P)-dependent alcohol dehydrogenase [Actinophytocola sp.]|uniref:NAD(P)-dependent alcohol dehydrogenase n=1 Tax=Actinophytocola sp. TaxID=1872138 RepID=UPI002ED4CBD9